MKPTATPGNASGETDTTLSDLARRVSLTASSRYGAARRLTYHNRLSTWTTAVASIMLILLPLMEVMQLQDRLPQPTSIFLQVLLAIFMLVYSLLLSSEEYSLYSERMHRCGVELTILSSEIRSAVEADEGKLANFNKRYREILDKYRNHNLSDYYWALIQDSLKKGGWKLGQTLRLATSATIRILFGFVHYLIVIGVVVYVMASLFAGR